MTTMSYPAFLATVEKVLGVTEPNVSKVYSGRAGRCCCGCSGQYRYSSSYVAAVVGLPGHADAADAEVNDRQVRKVLGIIRDAALTAGPETTDDALSADDAYIAATIGDRLYIAYLR